MVLLAGISQSRPSRSTLITAVDKESKSLHSHSQGSSITCACSWKSPGTSSDEDAFMTATAAGHEVTIVRIPQYNLIVRARGGVDEWSGGVAE